MFTTYGVQVLQRMQGGLVINQISRSFEALFTESTLISFRHLVNVSNVLFQRIQVWRFLAAVAANVVKLLCSVVFYMPVVTFNIWKTKIFKFFSIPRQFLIRPAKKCPHISHRIRSSTFLV